MKRKTIYFVFLCTWLGLTSLVIWWKNVQMGQMREEMSKENELLKTEQMLLLENSMLQYSYNGLLMNDFRLYDECGCSLSFSDLLDYNYKFVLKISQYHCSSCVDYIMKELKLISSKVPNDRILIIAAFENKRLFQIVRKKYSGDIPIYFLKKEDDSDEILNEENMPYICLVNEKRTIKELLIPIKEVPYHTQRYFDIIIRKYFKSCT